MISFLTGCRQAQLLVAVVLAVVLAVAQEAAVNTVPVSTLEATFQAQERVACRGRIRRQEMSTTSDTQAPQ